MSEEKIKDRVEKMTTVNFSITKCPLKVHQEFIQFCKEETNENYSMGLRLLLNASKTNAKEAILYEQYMVLREEFEDTIKEVEDRIRALEGKGKESKKTFGSQ
jgi:hypothetical protein